MIDYIVGNIEKVDDKILIKNDNNICFELVTYNNFSINKTQEYYTMDYVDISCPEGYPELEKRYKGSIIYTYLTFNERDGFKIFGFYTRLDRELFLEIIKTNGVGSKAALNLLSEIDGEQLKKLCTLYKKNPNEVIKRITKIKGFAHKTSKKIMDKLSKAYQ